MLRSVDIYSKKRKLKDEFIKASHKRFVGDSAAHGHDFFEIEMILDGSGTYVIDGVRHPIKPNMLFLMTPIQTHSVIDANMEVITVMFQCEYDGEFFFFPIMNGTNTPVYHLSENESRFLSSLLFEIVAAQKKNIPYSMLLLRCVLHKLSDCTPIRQEAALPSYIQHSILYILENFRSGITLEDVAAHLGLSKVYFSEYFSKHMGVNFKTYLDDIRFSYVEKMLTFTNLSISEIHERAGFRDYANFARRFKQKYGLSPGEYRKKP